jgi:hypothetical protein
MNLAETIKLLFPVPEVHAFIRKEGDQHCVKSHSGKSLGCYQTASGAKKRLKQVEYFKHVKADSFYGPDEGGMGPSEELGSPE